jgi:hypothetical protein
MSAGEPFRAPGEEALTDARLFEEIYRTWAAAVSAASLVKGYTIHA